MDFPFALPEIARYIAMFLGPRSILNLSVCCKSLALLGIHSPSEVIKHIMINRVEVARGKGSRFGYLPASPFCDYIHPKFTRFSILPHVTCYSSGSKRHLNVIYKDAHGILGFYNTEDMDRYIELFKLKLVVLEEEEGYY